MIRRRVRPLLRSLALAALLGHPVPASSQSEMPRKFTPQTSRFDYSVREVMIPMRDGLKLHAVIIVPRGAAREPILLTRTPYNANSRIDAAVRIWPG